MTSVVSWGADPNGVVDSTRAFNEAATNDGPIHIPTGTYIISSPVTLTVPAQLVTGDGRERSIISVPPGFSGSGVFVCNTGEPGPQFRDFSINFQQPNTTPIQYAPAIYAQSTPRLRARDVRIANAWTAISMPGNCGGSVIVDAEISAYNVGIAIDGSQDSVRIRGLHFWPFGVPASLLSYLSAATAITSGRCDDLHIDDCLLILGLGLRLYQSVNGTTFGRATGTDFDTCSGINMSAGVFTVSNCFFSQGGLATQQAIAHAGGNLVVGNSYFAMPVLSVPVIASSARPGFITVSDSFFAIPTGQTLTNPIVFVSSGGRIIFTGNRAADVGAGSGTLLSLAVDDWHIVANNAFMGWGLQVPATLSSAIVANNSGSAQVAALPAGTP